ncbi:hypothetical protein [Nostoc sp.]
MPPLVLYALMISLGRTPSANNISFEQSAAFVDLGGSIKADTE